MKVEIGILIWWPFSTSLNDKKLVSHKNTPFSINYRIDNQGISQVFLIFKYIAKIKTSSSIAIIGNAITECRILVMELLSLEWFIASACKQFVLVFKGHHPTLCIRDLTTLTWLVSLILGLSQCSMLPSCREKCNSLQEFGQAYIGYGGLILV